MARITLSGIKYDFVLKFGVAQSERLAIPLIKLVPHSLRVVIDADTWGFKNSAYLKPVIQAFVKTGNSVSVEDHKGTFIEYSPAYPNGNFALYTSSSPQPATQPTPQKPPQPAPMPNNLPVVDVYSTPVSVPFTVAPTKKPRKARKNSLVVLGSPGQAIDGLKIVIDSLGSPQRNTQTLKQGSRIVGFMNRFVFLAYTRELDEQERKNKAAHEIELDTTTYFATLGVPETTNDARELRKGWIAQLQKFHPDKMKNSLGSKEATIAINAAFEYLKDDQRRQKYVTALQKTRKLFAIQPSRNNNIKVYLPGYVPGNLDLIRRLASFTLVCDAVVREDRVTFYVDKIHEIIPTIKDGKVFIIGDGWVDGSQYGV